LPALGPVQAPVMERVLGPPPELPEEVLPMDSSMSFSQPQATPITPSHVKSPEQLAMERRLSGAVFVAVTDRAPTEHQPEALMSSERERERARLEGMDEWLTPTVTPAAVAGVLPSSRLLLPKGAFVDCTLETALDSTLPGMATCITATDTFSVDGSVVLLERGTKLVGETRGSMRQGQARIFVLWTQARTPEGVVVDLASPGTDELGRSGLPGEVDRHFFERFGAAMLISLIDGVVQSAVQSSMGGSTVIYNPSTSQDILTEVLRSTVNIPPTVRKAQGDRIQVLVARDLDFRSVYRLRAVARDESGHAGAGR
jgi:type IV secretion system protein VirB10